MAPPPAHESEQPAFGWADFGEPSSPAAPVAAAPAPAPAALEVDVSAGDGSGGEDGGDGDGADGDGGGTKSRRGDKIPKEKSHLKQRVEVGQKPLVVRSGFNTTSEHVGTLPKGVLMTVLEERLTPEGDVRARISLVEEKEGIPPVQQRCVSPDSSPSDVSL